MPYSLFLPGYLITSSRGKLDSPQYQINTWRGGGGCVLQNFQLCAPTLLSIILDVLVVVVVVVTWLVVQV